MQINGFSQFFSSAIVHTKSCLNNFEKRIHVFAVGVILGVILGFLGFFVERCLYPRYKAWRDLKGQSQTQIPQLSKVVVRKLEELKILDEDIKYLYDEVMKERQRNSIDQNISKEPSRKPISPIRL